MKQLSWKKIKQGPYVMYAFLAIQTLVFLVMEYKGWGMGGSQNPQILYRFGALERQSVIFYHEYWRFVTPIFIHIGLTHFAVNSVTLYFVGAQIEMIYGHTRFFFLYLLSGIFGNLFSFAISSTNSLSAGASTSLFGLFGAFIMLWRIFRDNPQMLFYIRRYVAFVGLNLVFNLFSPSIDILGHIGGLLGGMILALAFSLPAPYGSDNKQEKWIMGIFFVLSCAFLLFYGFKKYGFTL